MDSNNSNLNPKQKDLVKRLEEIRQNRKMQETQEKVQKKAPSKRSLEQQDRSKKRNRNQQQRPAKKAQQAPTAGRQKKKQSTQSQKQRSARKQTSYPRKYSSVKQPPQSKQTRKNKDRLIEQLSDSDKLADAIILSEILSKPVALRKRYR